MELYLHHGRKTADEELEDWGFDGPRLQGVTGIHVTYLTHYSVHFESAEACATAQALTGWDRWDVNALRMLFEDDLVKTKDGLFGDWGLM